MESSENRKLKEKNILNIIKRNPKKTIDEIIGILFSYMAERTAKEWLKNMERAKKIEYYIEDNKIFLKVKLKNV